MSFTDAEEVAIRYYCGYPSKGSPTGYALGMRFYLTYGSMEYRMSNLTAGEEQFVRDHFLTPLAGIEVSWTASVDDLDTDKAAVWSRNKDEVRDKRGLYMRLRKDLCAFFGILYGGDVFQTDVSTFGIKI